VVVLDIAEFKELYPAFSDLTDTTITNSFNMASMFIENETNCYLDEDQLKTVMYMMTAHLLQIQTNTAKNTSGVVTSASIDKVSVTIAEPKNKTEFSHFMNQTPYGTQLLALFKMLAVGGFYIGGRPEVASFRKAGGTY
jgi:hypothetical protein